MKYKHKLFLAIFLTSNMILTIVAYLSYRLVSTELNQNFVNHYRSQSQVIQETIRQLEKSTELLSISAAYHLRDLERLQGLPSQETLEKLAKDLNVTQFTITDANGKFIRDTITPPEESDKSLFDFCAGYRELITGGSDIEKTPIIPSYPFKGPYKFTMIPNHDRSRVLEVGMNLSAIGDILRNVIMADGHINSVGFYSASGFNLGTVGKDGTISGGGGPSTIPSFRDGVVFDEASHRLYLTEKLATPMTQCCECKMKGASDQGDGSYYYVLRTEVSTEPLSLKLRDLKKNIALLFGCMFLGIAVFSNFLANRLIRRLENIDHTVTEIMLKNDLSLRINDTGRDEIASLARTFDMMLSSLRDSQQGLLNAEKNNAIARTTQMLAHDVRKPFSMIQMILGIIASSEDTGEIKKVATHFIPEVSRSLTKVNGMLADIMEASAVTAVNPAPVDPYFLLENGLKDAFSYEKGLDISVETHLLHRHYVLADENKVHRVIANIFSNALQAMKNKGSLWINTQEVEDGFTRFTLGNSGSFISPAELASIFEAFYTKGKAGGTGLGLAIAKKIIEEHGGRIWCQSSEENGTEFHFTLKTDFSQSVHGTQRPLPSHSSYFQAQPIANSGLPDNQAEEMYFEMRLAELIKDGDSKTLLIVDDESVYREALANQITRSQHLRDKIKVVTAQDADEGFIKASDPHCVMIIVDVDLGVGDNGFELVRRVKKQGTQAKICIHSNRGALDYQYQAMSAGADIFIPKPMTRIHLLKILESALASVENLV